MVGSLSITRDVRWPPVNRRRGAGETWAWILAGSPWSRTRRSANSASGHRVGLSRKQLRAAIGPVGEAGPHRKNSTGRWSPRPRSASWMVRSARRPTRSEAAASTCSGSDFWRDWGSSWPSLRCSHRPRRCSSAVSGSNMNVVCPRSSRIPLTPGIGSGGRSPL